MNDKYEQTGRDQNRERDRPNGIEQNFRQQLSLEAWRPDAQNSAHEVNRTTSAPDVSSLLTSSGQEYLPNVQIVSDSQPHMLKGYAKAEHQSEPTHYHSAYDQLDTPTQHHHRLHLGASEQHAQQIQPHRQQPQHHGVEMWAGKTTVPAIHGSRFSLPSETISTTLKASDYHEGERFNQVLTVPNENGKSNYYNGLANARFENGHLYGVPTHIVNGQMTFPYEHEIDIPLHKK